MAQVGRIATEEHLPAIFGQFGLVRLAMVGDMRGTVMGKTTGYKYAVNPGKNIWVDKREAAQLLSLLDQDGGSVFAETAV